jgi:hypothetical protein
MSKLTFHLVAAACCLASCATDEDQISSANQEVAVNWTNIVGVTATTNNLVKTAATAWGNGGASSIESVASDSFVEFTTNDATTAKIAGLSLGDSNQADTDIDFGIYPSVKNKLFIIESGNLIGQFGTYIPGDVFRVESVERVVRYYKNGTLIHTSTRVPQFPAIVDTALHHTGATINNVVISDFNFTNVVGVDILSTTSIRKTAGLANTFGNSGAISTRSIKADTGFTEFSSGELTATKAAGLSTSDPNQLATSISFGWLLSAGAGAQVIENGTPRFTDTVNWTTTDVFRVEVVDQNGTPRVQYLKNGVVVFTSTASVLFPLVFDSAFQEAGGTLTNIKLEDTFWTNVVGSEAIGNNLFGTVAGTGYGQSGASTLTQIASGDGFMEFTTAERNTTKAAGLSNGDTDQTANDIDFAISLTANGKVYVLENGKSRGVFGDYQVGEVYRVEVTSNVVRYLRNGTVFFTSTKVPTFPLRGDSALIDRGATIKNARMFGSATDNIPRDPISGFAVPLTQADWNAVFDAAGVTRKTVNQSWSFQDASGNAAAEIGSPLVASATLDYLQDVPGWARKAIMFAPEGGSEFLFQPKTVAQGPDSTLESVLMFSYQSTDPVLQARRTMVISGGSNNAMLLSVINSNLRLVCDGTVSIGTAVVTGAVVHPLFLQYDRTNSVARAYSDQEILAGTFSPNVADSTRGYGTSNNTGSNAVQRTLLGAQFKGSDAEWTEAEMRAVVNVLINGAVPW